MTSEERNYILANYDGCSDKIKNRLRIVIQTLLNRTFIVREKDEVLYRCAVGEWRNYLRLMLEDTMGFKLYFQPEIGVIRLSCEDDLNQDDNLRYGPAIMKAPLRKKSADLLVILMLMYSERSERLVRNSPLSITISDIKAVIENRGLSAQYQKNGFVGDIKDSLKLFKHHNLIDFKTGELDIKDENTEITLYQSLLLSIRPDELKNWIELHMPASADAEDETDGPEDLDEEEIAFDNEEEDL